MNKPGECRKALTAAEKYQYHCNQRLLASKGVEVATLRDLLTRFDLYHEGEWLSAGEKRQVGDNKGNLGERKL